jgi:hypothetical protein
MWIMVAGPYTGGAKTEADRENNLKAMNSAALGVFEKGHLPLIGVNNALPLIQIAGADHFEEIMMPVSLAVAERCDACLRIGGPSQGADDEMKKFQVAGKPVYTSIDEVPDAQQSTATY